MLGFANLTHVASKDEPSDVLRHMRPPILLGKECVCCEETVMTDIVMCDGDEEEPMVSEYNSFGTSGVLSPESILGDKELGTISHEGFVFGIGEIVWSL